MEPGQLCPAIRNSFDTAIETKELYTATVPFLRRGQCKRAPSFSCYLKTDKDIWWTKFRHFYNGF